MLSDAETDRSFQNRTKIPQQAHSWQCSDFTLLCWFSVLIQQVWLPKTSDGMLNIHLFSITAYPELRVMSTNPSCLKVRLHSAPLLLHLFSHNCLFYHVSTWHDMNEKASPTASQCNVIIVHAVETDIKCGGFVKPLCCTWTQRAKYGKRFYARQQNLNSRGGIVE